MKLFERSRLVLGDEAEGILKKAAAAVFGIGGVGSFAAEALARSGIGTLILIDNDVVEPSNLNRQLTALHSTIGRYKTHVMAERIRDINPQARVVTMETFVLPDVEGFVRIPEVFDTDCFILDAVDTVSAKIALAVTAADRGLPIISAMGCGNKRDPSLLRVADMYSTSVCPLCRVMRRELKKRNIPALKVVFSTEQPVRSQEGDLRVPGSVPWVPSAAGLIMAGEAVQYLISRPRR
ncbi:MAG: tRNA threonylcarbamoyladenosine dehydratase [Spirochaetaceae bacterium]|jgi:tRNA A37 threonylcarbamoyladenosine dehydratase|nr:tRNA threonylcarbamoyladenosine dehydratase [Spirochaetaceae bacterium]